MTKRKQGMHSYVQPLYKDHSPLQSLSCQNPCIKSACTLRIPVPQQLSIPDPQPPLPMPQKRKALAPPKQFIPIPALKMPMQRLDVPIQSRSNLPIHRDPIIPPYHLSHLICLDLHHVSLQALRMDQLMPMPLIIN